MNISYQRGKSMNISKIVNMKDFMSRATTNFAIFRQEGT